MKKLIILFLLCISISLSAQNYASVIIPITSWGAGIRYDRQLNSMGIYASTVYEHSQFDKCSTIDNQLKYSLGFDRFFLSTDSEHIEIYSFAGLNYSHFWSDGKVNAANLSNHYDQYPNMFKTFSFELGVGYVVKRWTFNISMDMLKEQWLFYIGYKF